METYSSCCVQGSAGFWSSYRSPTDPERGGQLFGLSEVVYNWLQGGAGPSTARTPPAAAPTAARCGEDRALCIVTTTTTTTTTTILGLQQWAQEDVTSSIAPWNLFPLCSASQSVRGSCNGLIYSHRFSIINNFNVYCQLSMY